MGMGWVQHRPVIVKLLPYLESTSNYIWCFILFINISTRPATVYCSFIVHQSLAFCISITSLSPLVTMRSVLANFAILAAPYLASAQSDNPFNGTGQIWVISGDDSTDLAKPPTPRIGCLANNGHVTSSNCGTFTVNRASNQPLKTSAGVCTFFDTTAELGRPLAPMFWALKCGKGPWSTQDPGYEFYHLVRIHSWNVPCLENIDTDMRCRTPGARTILIFGMGTLTTNMQRSMCQLLARKCRFGQSTPRVMQLRIMCGYTGISWVSLAAQRWFTIMLYLLCKLQKGRLPRGNSMFIGWSRKTSGGLHRMCKESL